MTKISHNTSPLPADIVTEGELARYLSISQRAVYNHTRSGRIPCIRFGRSKRYSISAVRAAINAS